ncbi:MAG: ATP-binding protein [Planctomycetota bacterium]
MASALARVSRSASELINADTIIGLVQTRPAASWHAYEFNAKGEALRPPKQLVHKDPSHVPDLEELIRPGVRHATHLGAITDQLSPTAQRAELQVVPMVAGWGPTVVLLMDADPHTALQHETLVHAVTSTWATTVAAASQQSGLRAVSEQLADSNRRLTDMQSRLVEAESLARLGELASGAAHEMNNPLTVITGKSQLLSSRIKEPENQKPLSEIVSAAHRLSALIDGLHFFASPPEARRTQVDLALLVERAAEAAHDRLGVGETMLSDDSSNFNAQETPIGITIDPVAEVIYADEESLAMALTEVMANAIEASPTTGVEVRAQVRVDGDRLEISVTDDGVGLTDHALHHACDPFFSDKEAGRQTGLGLAKARRIAEMHGGFVELARTPDGTRVSITLDAWRTGSQRPAQERAA